MLELRIGGAGPHEDDVGKMLLTQDRRNPLSDVRCQIKSLGVIFAKFGATERSTFFRLQIEDAARGEFVDSLLLMFRLLKK